MITGGLRGGALACLAVSSIACPAGADPLADPPVARLADRGQAVAEAHCTRCHVVGDFNPRGGISSTPSFQMLVNALADWEERFSTFFDRRPHPAAVRFKGLEPLSSTIPTMVQLELETDDVAAIVAFVRTLKE